MDLFENPLKYIIPILITLIFFLLLFRFNNWVDERKVSDKKTKSEPAKADTKDKKELVNLKEEKEEEKIKDDIIVVNTNSNYLYDRFVENPTRDDVVETKDDVNSAFLSEEDARKIRFKQTKIRVGDVKVHSNEKELLYNKIEAMKNENLALKEKLLKEFNSLSKEMKLMLIENIIQNMD